MLLTCSLNDVKVKTLEEDLVIKKKKLYTELN